MNYALGRVLPEVPPGGVSAGADWGNTAHAACVLDGAGRVADRFAAANDRAGIAALTGRLLASGAREAAIERGDGPLADSLAAAGLTLVVIPPGQVQRLRDRHVSSGAKDDHLDAHVLADVLRTGRARLRPLVPDSPQALALRAAVRARSYLLVGGMLTGAAGYVIMAWSLRTAADPGPLYLVVNFVLSAAFGYGFGPVLSMALSRVPLKFAGGASGILVSTLQLGQLLGIAVYGSVYFALARTASASVSAEAFAHTLYWAALACTAGALAGLLFIRSASGREATRP